MIQNLDRRTLQDGQQTVQEVIWWQSIEFVEWITDVGRRRRRRRLAVAQVVGAFRQIGEQCIVTVH